MEGKRREDNLAPWELEAGEYCFRGDPPRRFLWVRLPNGVGPSRLEGWEVEEHEDGTVSVSPSIQDIPTDGSVGWHGFLKRGVWSEV